MMKQSKPLSNENLQCPAGTADRLAAPLDVFYVVQTTDEITGERHHCVRSPLFETRRQARTALTRLLAANAGSGSSSGTYSMWKSSTYVEPAEWSHDVVMADGTVIQSRRGHSRGADAREDSVSFS